MTRKLFIGGALAFILLGLYVYSIVIAILIANCVGQSNCSAYNTNNFNDGMVIALTLIGGLVSALVITELAITKPGEAPLARTLETNTPPAAVNAVKIVSTVYLIIWVFAGLAAFVVGNMQHPKVLQPLTDLGASWMGLAVAACYSYLGIKPSATP